MTNSTIMSKEIKFLQWEAQSEALSNFDCINRMIFLRSRLRSGGLSVLVRTRALEILDRTQQQDIPSAQAGNRPFKEVLLQVLEALHDLFDPQEESLLRPSASTTNTAEMEHSNRTAQQHTNQYGAPIDPAVNVPSAPTPCEDMNIQTVPTTNRVGHNVAIPSEPTAWSRVDQRFTPAAIPPMPTQPARLHPKDSMLAMNGDMAQAGDVQSTPLSMIPSAAATVTQPQATGVSGFDEHSGVATTPRAFLLPGETGIADAQKVQESIAQSVNLGRNYLVEREPLPLNARRVNEQGNLGPGGNSAPPNNGAATPAPDTSVSTDPHNRYAVPKEQSCGKCIRAGVICYRLHSDPVGSPCQPCQKNYKTPNCVPCTPEDMRVSMERNARSYARTRARSDDVWGHRTNHLTSGKPRKEYDYEELLKSRRNFRSHDARDISKTPQDSRGLYQNVGGEGDGDEWAIRSDVEESLGEAGLPDPSTSLSISAPSRPHPQYSAQSPAPESGLDISKLTSMGSLRSLTAHSDRPSTRSQTKGTISGPSMLFIVGAHQFQNPLLRSRFYDRLRRQEKETPFYVKKRNEERSLQYGTRPTTSKRYRSRRSRKTAQHVEPSSTEAQDDAQPAKTRKRGNDRGFQSTVTLSSSASNNLGAKERDGNGTDSHPIAKKRKRTQPCEAPEEPARDGFEDDDEDEDPTSFPYTHGRNGLGGPQLSYNIAPPASQSAFESPFQNPQRSQYQHPSLPGFEPRSYSERSRHAHEPQSQAPFTLDPPAFLAALPSSDHEVAQDSSSAKASSSSDAAAVQEATPAVPAQPAAQRTFPAHQFHEIRALKNLVAFHNGAIIALENIVEDHAADPSLSVTDIIQELIDTTPIMETNEGWLVLLGRDWVFRLIEDEIAGLEEQWEDEEGAVEALCEMIKAWCDAEMKRVEAEQVERKKAKEKTKGNGKGKKGSEKK